MNLNVTKKGNNVLLKRYNHLYCIWEYIKIQDTPIHIFVNYIELPIHTFKTKITLIQGKCQKLSSIDHDVKPFNVTNVEYYKLEYLTIHT